METLESFVRFLSSYPLWAKLLAVGGILTTAVTLALAPRSPQIDPQRNAANATDTVFLKILRVKLYRVDPQTPVQVIAYLNDDSYVYPSGVPGVEWIKVGEGMSGQSFEIPKMQHYKLKFELKLQTSPGNVQVLVNNEPVPKRTLPMAGTYDVHAVVENIKEAAIAATIDFSLSSER
jgi:hypothetical protein